MKDRPYLKALIGWGIAAALGYIGARYGIVIPPPPALVPQLPPAGGSGHGGSPPQTEPEVKPDTLAAIGRIIIGDRGCTATIVGPRRADGRYDILTAAHCCTRPGDTGRMRLRSGREIAFRITAIDRQADCAWGETLSESAVLPFALLAERTPEVGTKIWHAGYGVDVPGNREDGTLTDTANSDGQVKMRLSVSSGDSGGGIAIDADGRIVSCVCCTSARDRMADVWGASVERIRKLRPSGLVWDEWHPLEIPVRESRP